MLSDRLVQVAGSKSFLADNARAGGGGVSSLQGRALDKVAHKDVKVLVVGNPCNTNALICSMNAPSIPKKNFHALTRLDENRAKCQLALKVTEPAYMRAYLCKPHISVTGGRMISV